MTMVAFCGSAVMMSEYCEAAVRWQTNMDRALSTAQSQDRPLLIEFTGSDWCPPCKHLRANVFPTEAFETYVRGQKLLLVELDFPRDPQKLTDEQKAHNEKWRLYYGVTSFPTIVVADAKGAPFGVVNGAAPAAPDYLDRLEAQVKHMAEVKSALAAAAKLSGIERATAEAEAIKYLPISWRMLHTDLVQDIISNDPEDTLGYARLRHETAVTEAQLRELDGIFSKFSGQGKPEQQDAAIELALSLLEDTKWAPVPRLLLNKFLCDSYAIKGDLDNTLKYMRAAVQSAPESNEARKLRPWLENMEKNFDAMKRHREEAAAGKPAAEQ